MKKKAMTKLLSYVLCLGAMTGSVTPALTTVAFAENEVTGTNKTDLESEIVGIYNQESGATYQTVQSITVNKTADNTYSVVIEPDFTKIQLTHLGGDTSKPEAAFVGFGIKAPTTYTDYSSKCDDEVETEGGQGLDLFTATDAKTTSSGFARWINILNPTYYQKAIKYEVTWTKEGAEQTPEQVTETFNVSLKAPKIEKTLEIAKADPVGTEEGPVFDEDTFSISLKDDVALPQDIKGDNIKEVDFTIRNLKSHIPTTSETKAGHWIGLTLTPPSGATNAKYNLVKEEELSSKTLFAYDTSSIKDPSWSDGKTHVWFNLDDLRETENVNKFKKAWISAVWLDASNKVKGCDYLLLNFDNVTLSEAKNAVTIDPTITNGKVEANPTEANKGEQVTLTATPKDGYEFKSFTVTGTNGEGVDVKADTTKENTGTFTMPDCSVTVSAIFEEIPAPTYAITVDTTIANGTVEANKTTAKADETVTLTATPNDNYKLTSFSVKDKDDKDVEVIPDKTNENKATFKMPASNVTVTAAFTEESKTPSVNPTPQRQPSSQTTQPTTDKTTDPDGTVTETTTYPDGTTTEKVTETDGTVTETTTKTDGSTEKTTTAKDGTVTEEKKASDGTETTTVKDPDGTTVYESTMNPDGSGTIETLSPEGNKTVIDLESDKSTTTTTTMADETVTEVKADANGNITSASANVSSKAVQNATGNAAPVELVLPAIPADHTANDVALDITLPEGTGDIEVAIPVENGNPGSVAMIEDENGQLVPIKESLVDENGKLIVPLDGSKKIVIKDNSKAFSDMPGYDKTSYPGEGVAYVSARKIFNGNEDGSFNLNGNVTRGMLARVLYNLEGNPSVAGLPVPAGVAIPWYKDASAWAANKKLMAQGSDFRGEDLLTREQLAMILWREQGKPAAKGDISVYDPQDVASISSPEMLEAVSWAVGEHIIGQNSPLNGQKESTRGEVANMLYRFLTKVESESNELI